MSLLTFPTPAMRVCLIALLSLLPGWTALASALNEVEQIIAQPSPPFGVVFEIAERDGDALAWAMPEVSRLVRQLRSRFPDIGLAVVSHGMEQFALGKDQQETRPDLHAGVANLARSDVPVHVCGTHARWRGKDEGDFPEYVDVTPAGPTEIRNYQAMGFKLIRVSRP